jgi:hypothetical protein
VPQLQRVLRQVLLQVLRVLVPALHQVLLQGLWLWGTAWVLHRPLTCQWG